MEKVIHDILICIGVFLFIVEYIVARKTIFNKEAPEYLKGFFVYPLVGLFIGALFIFRYFHLLNSQTIFKINNLSLLFHYAFLSLFIYRAIGKNSIFLKIIVIFFFLVLLLVVFDLGLKSSTSFALANGCLFTYCLYYFYKLLNTDFKIELSRDPAFIICCGIFLGSGLIVPMTLMHKYLLIYNVLKSSLFLYGMFFQMGYIIMNIFFIKALLCLKPQI